QLSLTRYPYHHYFPSFPTRRSSDLGHAHSVEAWKDGALAGGLYGVAIGGAFFGESMFHEVRDASKVALLGLVERLRSQKFVLLRSEEHTSELQSQSNLVCRLLLEKK